MLSFLKKFLPKKQSKIIIIAAIQNDRGIGYQDNLIHHIKKDMQHFVNQTTGHTVVMGRKNWETIPEKFRPFKNRQSIIITRNKNYTAAGALVTHSLEEAIIKASSEKIYIIGGGEIYKQVLAYADTLDLTIINANKPADTFFPEFENKFKVVQSSEEMYDEESHTSYIFTVWEKKK
ncbi:hypothetical protein CL684_02125 [Candidatus Campbellbacteria bacterium]|nr:hypothetical protein [Candidatus Campbellbacteria bacterium]|tara:strand:- start:518 stop:1048 length:531 start_codon:yes stop_codon:yes gene_type:complete